MKISSVKPYIFKSAYKGKYLSSKADKNTEARPLLSLQKSASIELQIKKEDDFFQEFLAKKGKVTRKEYDEILKKHPRTIIKSLDVCDETLSFSAPQNIARFALGLKEYYDKMYGSNYTIVSIGSSPAIVSEVMQNLGCEVIFAPLSDIRWLEFNQLHPMRNSYPTIASRHENVELLMKYCTQKGVTKAKKLILLDFTVSGQSLRNAKKIFEERDDTTPLIYTHSINDDLREIAKMPNTFNINSKEVGYFIEDLKMCNFESAVNVPHFSYDGENRHVKHNVSSTLKNKKKLFREFEQYSTSQGRAWALCSLHEAMKILKNYIS